MRFQEFVRFGAVSCTVGPYFMHYFPLMRRRVSVAKNITHIDNQKLRI